MDELTASNDLKPYPEGGYVELYTRWIGETVLEVEAALIAGADVASLLDQPDTLEVLGPILTERYRRLVGHKIKHDGVFRESWIKKIIAEFQFSLRQPERLFSARDASQRWECRPTSGDQPSVPSLVASCTQGPATLRPDQILSARRWGIWFEFDDVSLERCYFELLVGSARNTLSSQIYDLSQIEATYLSGRSNLKPVAEWDTNHRGSRFEHLILDIFNEDVLAAKRAGLAEDMLERTDLRLKSPLLERRQGARIQVSLVVDAELQARKINALRFPGELVILTPATLAETIIQRPKVLSFEQLSWDDLSHSLGIKLEANFPVAEHLHELFVASFTLATNHPSGPAYIVPPLVRQFIRLFAEAAAVETTGNMRSRERYTGRWRGSARKFNGQYRSSQ